MALNEKEFNWNYNNSLVENVQNIFVNSYSISLFNDCKWKVACEENEWFCFYILLAGQLLFPPPIISN